MLRSLRYCGMDYRTVLVVAIVTVSCGFFLLHSFLPGAARFCKEAAEDTADDVTNVVHSLRMASRETSPKWINGTVKETEVMALDAYIDDRAGYLPPSAILFVLYERKMTSSRADAKCLLLYAGIQMPLTVSATITHTSHVRSGSLAGAVVTCSLPVSHPLPRQVALLMFASNQRPVRSKAIPLRRMVKRLPPQVLAACLAVTSSDPYYLIHWFETVLVTGTQHLVVYNISSDVIASKVLEHYHLHGAVTVVNLFSRVTSSPVEEQKALARAHCLFTRMFDFRYVVSLQAGELLVASKLQSLTATLEKQHSWSLAPAVRLRRRDVIINGPLVASEEEPYALRYRMSYTPSDVIGHLFHPRLCTVACYVVRDDVMRPNGTLGSSLEASFTVISYTRKSISRKVSLTEFKDMDVVRVRLLNRIKDRLAAISDGGIRLDVEWS